MKIIFCLFFALTQSIAFAEIIDLIHISNEENEKITHLAIQTDKDNSIQKIIDETHLGKDIVSRYEYEIEQLTSSGIVMYRTSGRDVVTLNSSNITNHYGGDITINYLYNGLTNNYKNMDIQLEKIDREWKILINGQKIRSLRLHVNKKPIVGTVGIKSISYQ